MTVTLGTTPVLGTIVIKAQNSGAQFMPRSRFISSGAITGAASGQIRFADSAPGASGLTVGDLFLTGDATSYMARATSVQTQGCELVVHFEQAYFNDIFQDFYGDLTGEVQNLKRELKDGLFTAFDSQGVQLLATEPIAMRSLSCRDAPGAN